MKAVAIVGYKDSGKTTLLLELIDQLSRLELRVAAAKLSHHALDRQGSDTELLSRKAHCVIGLGQEQTSVFWKRASFLADLVPLLDSDILLVEGGRHLQTMPRVIIPRDQAEAESLSEGLALAVWSESVSIPGVPSFHDSTELAGTILDRTFMLPGLDCQACGYEACAELAADIVAGQARSDACQALAQDFSIRVNGEQLALNPFVRSIISGSILGMLTNLKGFAPGAIDIHMES